MTSFKPIRHTENNNNNTNNNNNNNIAELIAETTKLSAANPIKIYLEKI